MQLTERQALLFLEIMDYCKDGVPHLIGCLLERANKEDIAQLRSVALNMYAAIPGDQTAEVKLFTEIDGVTVQIGQ